MTKVKVLVADGDPRNLNIVTLALRRAGFEPLPASDGAQALRALQGGGVQAVVCDAAVADPGALELCRSARGEQGLANIPFVLVGSDAAPAAKARAIEAGADDYLVKPVLLKEVAQRLQHLIERRRLSDPGAPAGLSGSVRDLGLVDVFQSLEGWRKSAIVRCQNGEQLARVWVKQGEVVDAELGALSGEAAFFRLLTWESGEFRVDFSEVARETRIPDGTQAALAEAMRRIDELARMAPLPMQAQLAVDVPRLEANLAELPDELNAVVRAFDGTRTLRAALDRVPMDDLSAMAAVQRLVEAGILRPSSRPVSLEEWVSAPPAPGGGGEPALPRILIFAPLRGIRRERLKREAEVARQKLAAGEPLRLHHVVSLPPRGAHEELGELRQISAAAGDAARTFAPDVPMSRVPSGDAPPIAPVAEPTPPPQRSRFRFKAPRWVWGAGAVVVALGIWVLRPQPPTDRKDAPWLETPAPAAVSRPADASRSAEAVTRGNDLFRQGKYAAAADEYKKALAAKPDSVSVLLALGDAYLESDRPRNAVSPLESAVRLDPKSARAQLLLGTAYHSLGRTADAARAYRRFLELEPSSEFAKDVQVILAHLGT